ncbi:receptor-type tyrosine-protein phosphatase U-like isoform X3 [Amblyomma americanum]
MHRKHVLRTAYLLSLTLLYVNEGVTAGGAIRNLQGPEYHLPPVSSYQQGGAVSYPQTAGHHNPSILYYQQARGSASGGATWRREGDVTGEDQVDAKRIACHTDARSSNCDYDQVCRVICPSNCATEGVNVWGTGRYAWESPICVAAAHDLRLLPGKETAVAFKRYKKDIADYRGSWRNMVKSKNKGSLGYWKNNGHYIFVSPRIEEPILDLTSVHVGYRHALNENHVQVCFGPAGHQIYFTHFNWSSRKHIGAYQYDGVFKTVWTVGQGGAPFGAFVCSVSGSVLSSATSLAMRRESNFPHTLSQTISVGEAATLNNVNGGRVSWYKDGDMARSAVVKDRSSRIEIVQAQLGDAGIYMFQMSHGSPQVTRLIVRACPTGTYGHDCKEKCPQCLNGGVCHDITGVCICPPGFAGHSCDRICSEYHFGQNCSHNCTEMASLAGGNPRCVGMLFCLPDPYGCSCYPGFQGIDCTKTCEKGAYGADCKQRRTCHCQGGNSCHPQWGVCPDRVCKEGYRDEPFCDREYPVLKEFFAQVVDEESIEVQWSRWNPLRGDKGEGNPDGYVIQYKERAANKWNRTDVIPETGNDTLSFVVTDLRPNTWHQVQVLVHDASGHVHSQTAPTSAVQTPCGAPLSAPHNLSHKETTDGIVELMWQLPGTSRWQCDSVVSEVKINGQSPYSAIGDHFYTFRATPYYKYRVQVRLMAGRDKFGPWSVPYEFTTREAAPGEVGSLSKERVSPKTYRLRWQSPVATNGVLRSYRLEIRMLHFNGFTCPVFTAYEKLNASTPAKETSTVVHSLRPSATYKVSILATTVADGPWKHFPLQTEEEAPEGPPQQLWIVERTEKSAKVSWSPPDCRLINGPITSYLTNRTSSDEWAPAEEQNVVPGDVLAMKMGALIPFTEYTLSVWPRNSVGVGPGANITFTTASSVPPPPRNLTVYSATSEQLAVTWLPPYPPHGILQSYLVRYKLVEESEFRKHLVLTSEEAVCEGEARERQYCARISGLIANRRYDVAVIAKNEDVQAWSEESNSVTAETRESKPGPPSQVRQQDPHETAVTISWNEPSLTNGVILGYRVTLAKRNSLPSGRNTSIEVPAEARQAQIDNLEPGTVYVAAVSARTSAGYGEAVEILVHTRPRIPVIGTKVELKTVDETAITLQLSPAGDEPGDIKSYYVLVERQDHGNRTKRSIDGSSKAADGAVNEWMGGTPDYNESVAMNLSFYMAAKMSPGEVRSGREFTVGDGLYYGGYYNAPLVPESTYSVGLAAEVDFEGDSRISYRLLSGPVTVRKQEPVGNLSTPTAVTICVLILMVAAFGAIWKWRKRIIGKLPRSFPHKPAVAASDAASLSIVEENDGLDFEMEEMSGSGSETTSKPLPLSDLQEYVQRMLAFDGLKTEFLNQPKGRQYPTIEAQRTENKIKNRYGNLLAYDHSRVKLKPIPGVLYSDYINANYIDGYCRPKRYIATQGPKHHTVDDFWRMVWQENVCKIVMLTGIVENGKTKCEKYWPEKTAIYGEIQVHFIAEEQFPDYVIHQLHITLADTTREVKHFHLTSWPDHGVPLYPNTVLTFRRKVNQYRTYNEAPVVVHCSAGIGRTGTYILLDNLLEQSQSEGVVDVVGQLSAMRQNRMNVVETLEQYNFVHRALMESVCIRDHSVPCSKMYDRYTELLSLDETTGKSAIVKEFEELKSLKPWFTPAHCTAASDPANLRKSRDVSVLAPDRCRPLLRDGTFVNAVYVNGFHKKDKFLVTQTPSSKDADDLWKLVIESGARTIVTLDVFNEDADVVPFWPTGGSARYGDHKVECTEDRNVNDMSVQVFKVTSKHKAPGSSGPVTVKHFHRSTWNSAEQMVDLVDHVERWQQQSEDKIILVQCRNGCAASGLFCCCALVLEKLKREQEVDVFYATRIVRENRPQFISDCDQYKFCYDTAVAYLESFEMYANFRQ